MTAAIEQLRELARRAEAGEPLNDLGPWLADALHLYLDQASEGMTLEAAFGIELPPARLRLAQRDEEIRALADRHFGHFELGRAAEAIARDASRYMAGRWPLDRNHADVPTGYEGTKKEGFWRALKASGGVFPTSGRQVRRILEEDAEP